MKNKLLVLALSALMPLSASSQDKRMRIASTIVADALAQLPASNKQNFNSTMKELASTGSQGVVQMAGMLVPADKGKNAVIEYALNGLVSYISQSGLESERQVVVEGLITALNQCKDNPNRAFLMTLLQRIAEKDNVQVFINHLNDDYLAERAINGILAIPGTEDVLFDLIQNEKASKATLAYAAGVQKLVKAEPILLKWLHGADSKTTTAIYKALGNFGTSASVKSLSDAAKEANYELLDENDATNSYINLLENLVKNGESEIATAEAKKLLKETDKSNLEAAAMKIIVNANQKDAVPFLLKALKDDSRDYRVNALHLISKFANEKIYKSIDKYLKSKKESTVQIDIMNWAGEEHLDYFVPSIITKLNSENKQIAQSAITALGRIGGETVLPHLVNLLGGKYSDFATTTLLSYNGDINKSIMELLDSDLPKQLAAINIVSCRHMFTALDKIVSLTKSSNNEIKKAAYNALPNLVQPKDFTLLVSLAEKGQYVDVIEQALKNSVKSLQPKEQAAIVLPIAKKSSKPYFYPVLGQIGNGEAIAEIRKGYNGSYKKEALKSLLSINNDKMINILFDIAKNSQTDAKAVLSRYARLVSSAKLTPVRKYQLYRQALEITSDISVQNTLIRYLGGTHTFAAFNIIRPFMDNNKTAVTTADAMRSLFSKNYENIGGEPAREALRKSIYITKHLGGGQAVYMEEAENVLATLPNAEYKPLYNGNKWKAVALNPSQQSKMGARKLKEAERKAEKAASKLWSYSKDVIKYLGGEKSQIGIGEFENFELTLEWRSEGKATLGIRSIPQINLGCNLSGALAMNENNNKPLASADNAKGEWNTLYVKVVDDRVTIAVNGIITTQHATLENNCDRNQQANAKGQILLVGEGSPVEFRDLYIRELPSSPVFRLSADEKKQGFDILFDGKSMHKWTGNKVNYLPQNGCIYVDAQYGGEGNLYTKKEYGDFVLRFEFCFLQEGVNNGIGIRTPMGVDAAYEGMEVQVLDHDAPIYKGLKHYQRHGSVYGVIPAKHIVFPKLGTWNTEEIRAVGDHITVTVNGQVIVDGNIREACKGKNLQVNGQKSGTVDGNSHPGLFNKKGHIGLLGHGEGMKYRNIRILDLSK